MSTEEELRQAERDAYVRWYIVRDINSGFGSGPAEAARVNHEIALLNLNRFLREQEAAKG